ncbi:MAG TPA: (2Fe-2S)-binding protein [Geminicoccaceae bacterium]|nr:(2Fe-2S)-binding protein [Geminicoccus sp.]HMU51788.1 (2Fe-2S)-binding protein [Geminicoccaceae bacterium]
MILCVCNGLSERDIRDAAATCRGASVGCVYRCLGCRVRCGKCVPYVADVAREAMAGSESPAPASSRTVVEIAAVELLVEAA